MSNQIFMSILLLSTTLTSLFTEAIKKNCKIPSNIIVAIMSVGISVFVSVTYAFHQCMIVDLTYVLSCVALAAMTWLCATLGYDKVIQTIKQMGD